MPITPRSTCFLKLFPSLKNVILISGGKWWVICHLPFDHLVVCWFVLAVDSFYHICIFKVPFHSSLFMVATLFLSLFTLSLSLSLSLSRSSRPFISTSDMTVLPEKLLTYLCWSVCQNFLLEYLFIYIHQNEVIVPNLENIHTQKQDFPPILNPQAHLQKRK